MPYDLIHTSLNDGIFTITMNRPNVKNAMSSEMMEEITFALNEAAKNDQVFFAVITGAGDYYCSGGDLKATGFGNQTMEEMLEYRIRVGKAMMAAFIDFPKILIAIVNGPSVGAAFTTLALCDIVYCTTNASFWAPFSALGLCAEGCSSYLFPRIMGTSRANNVLQFGQKLNATEAKEYGVVADVYEPEQIQTVLWPKIRRMKETLSQEALLANKKLERKWDAEILHQVNEAEWKELESRFVSEDFISTVLKFIQRNRNKAKLNKLCSKMPYDLIQTSLNDGIFTITMSRPKMKNAMSAEMMEEISSALNEAARNDDVRFAVITGAGDYYCSGFDLKAGGFESQTMNEILKYRIRVGKAMMAAFIDFPKILIAIVNGPSVGAAFTTLALCDIAYCTTNATFWAPFSALGLCAEGCSTYLFPRIMGVARANNILQFGKKLNADEAKEYGLVADIYKTEEIETVLWPKIRQMKDTLSHEALLANKKLMRLWDSQILHQVNEAEWKELESRFVSDDFVNAIRKFVTVNKKKENKL